MTTQLIMGEKNLTNDLDYKLVICGISGAGKTTIEKHFFHDLSFQEIQELKLGPTRDIFSFTEKPIKIGNLTIRGIDTGGQQLLREKLHKGHAQELCWIGTDACIYVTDLAKDILKYENLKDSNLDFDEYIWNKMNEIQEDLKNVLNSLLKFTPVNLPVRVIVLFHKWDLLNRFSNEIREEWKKWLIDRFIETDEYNYKILTNNNGGKIKFLGFLTSSILDHSCKTAIRKLIPAYTQINKVLQNFIEKCRYFKANQVYITLLNEDGLEIDSLNYPYALETEPYFEGLVRYFIPILALQDQYEAKRLTNLCIMENPDLCLAIRSFTDEISMAVATDLKDFNQIRNLLDESIHSLGDLFKIYY